ncbi:unnamed protein product [Brachionus calyciflorus]|uniref:Uncharacterized protein n=1 Tax=Brachionus calyciflorus TaxID=104777 RepID=A0A814RFT9_9BILA|nr:unnamed protein product [Brachionus calyciflorus]
MSQEYDWDLSKSKSLNDLAELEILELNPPTKKFDYETNKKNIYSIKPYSKEVKLKAKITIESETNTSFEIERTESSTNTSFQNSINLVDKEVQTEFFINSKNQEKRRNESMVKRSSSSTLRGTYDDFKNSTFY